MKKENFKLYKNIFYVVIILTLLVVSLLAFLNKSNGWFVFSKKAETSNVAGILCSDNYLGISGITIYKIENNNQTPTRYNNPNNEEMSSILSLNEYDSVFPEKRAHTPIIIKLTLGNFHDPDQVVDFDVRLSLNTENTGFTKTIGDVTTLSDYISNFILVKVSADGTIDDTSKGAEEFYYEACGKFDLMNSTTFVNYSNSLEQTTFLSKADNITFPIVKNSGVSKVDVFIYINYDENLITKYVSDNKKQTGSVGELSEYFSWGETVEFEEDIHLIEIVGDEHE